MFFFNGRGLVMGAIFVYEWFGLVRRILIYRYQLCFHAAFIHFSIKNKLIKSDLIIVELYD